MDFFTNYNSPKAKSLQNSKINALFFWSKTNVQIRIKANIKKLMLHYQIAILKRKREKCNFNNLKSIKKYHLLNKLKKNLIELFLMITILIIGLITSGFSFIPYYFEFWEGNDLRLNKRTVYEFKDKNGIITSLNHSET